MFRRRTRENRSGKIFRLAALVAVLLSTEGPAVADSDVTFGEQLQTDFRLHYGWRSLGNVAVGFGITGILANTDIDTEIQDVFRDDLQGGLGNDLTAFFTDVGDVAQPLPAVAIYAGAMWLGSRQDQPDTAVGRWGGHSLRAMLIGTPQLVALSHLSGGQRPEEGEAGWDPFEDDNGVSGHSFFGSLPILTAARMTERRWLRNTLFAVSVLPGLARVYDDKHYLSQAFMGWWLANASSRTVERTNRDLTRRAALEPVLLEDGVGFQIAGRFR